MARRWACRYAAGMDRGLEALRKTRAQVADLTWPARAEEHVEEGGFEDACRW